MPPVFTINGRTAETPDAAFDIVREEWAKVKAPAVEDQHIEALSKPTQVDLERAKRGISQERIAANIEAAGGVEKIEKVRADAHAEGVAREEREAREASN